MCPSFSSLCYLALVFSVWADRALERRKQRDVLGRASAVGHLQSSELQTARDLCGPGSSAACRAASVPTQELGENSCFGSSSSWDQPWLSRLGAEFELSPSHAQVPKGSLVRAAQVSAQPDRRNCCGKGEGKKPMLRASAVHWFHLALLAQPGKALGCP